MTILLVFITVCAKGNTPKSYESAGEHFYFEILTQQSDVIWGFDFLDEQRIIFTERGGSLKVLDLKSAQVTKISGSPQVHARGQGGLLDVRVHPDNKSKIYLTYTEHESGANTTALAHGTFTDRQLIDVKKIFASKLASKNQYHFGSRIEFDREGHLWLTLGDFGYQERAQSLKDHNGKIIRIKEDGSVPGDNPFLKTKENRPEIWSYGHRNPQGLVLNPETKELWSTELGPFGGDELNLIKKGNNYGWPIISHGLGYDGSKIGEGSKKIGMEQPISYWVPSISPSGLTLYKGGLFPKWKGDLFLGSLSGMHLRRLRVVASRVLEQEALLSDLHLRIRNVRSGPDGGLYLSTDDGKIGRLVPVKKP